MSTEKKTEQPMTDPKVDVTVAPKEKTNPGPAKKLEDQIKNGVKKAIEQNKSGGAEKQFDAAKEETKRATQDANPGEIKKIVVKVSNDNGRDKEERVWTKDLEKK